MDQLPRIFAYAFFILAFALDAFAIDSADAIAEGLKEIRKIDRDVAIPEDKIVPMRLQLERMGVEVNRTPLKLLSDDDVRDFFQAASTVIFYTNDPADVRQLTRAYDELSRRHLDTHRDRKDVLASYVSARLEREAKDFVRRASDQALAVPPKFEGASTSGQTLWHLAADGTSLTRYEFKQSGPHVIVVSAPWCHFSQEAVTAIEKTPDLLAIMGKKSTWILPQGVIHEFGDVQRWTSAHPLLPMELVYRRIEWPAITSWDTPTFYFFDDDKLVTTLTGWPGPEQLSKLKTALSQVGLR